MACLIGARNAVSVRVVAQDHVGTIGKLSADQLTFDCPLIACCDPLGIHHRHRVTEQVETVRPCAASRINKPNHSSGVIALVFHNTAVRGDDPTRNRARCPHLMLVQGPRPIGSLDRGDVPNRVQLDRGDPPGEINLLDRQSERCVFDSLFPTVWSHSAGHTAVLVDSPPKDRAITRFTADQVMTRVPLEVGDNAFRGDYPPQLSL